MEAIANNDYALIMLYLGKLNLLTLSNSEFIWAKLGEAKIWKSNKQKILGVQMGKN